MKGRFEVLRLFLCLSTLEAFKILQPGDNFTTDAYFAAYSKGFTQRTFDPVNPHRISSRVNPGVFRTETDPRQVCPGMVGPFEGDKYFCVSQDNGYCDRR